jgi:hypothetical protein
MALQKLHPPPPPLMPQSLHEIKIRIRDAYESQDIQILFNVWSEIDLTIVLTYADSTMGPH